MRTIGLVRSANSATHHTQRTPSGEQNHRAKTRRPPLATIDLGWSHKNCMFHYGSHAMSSAGASCTAHRTSSVLYCLRAAELSNLNCSHHR